MTRRVWGLGASVSVVGALLVALPAAPATADEPVVTTTDDVITYTDPSLATADTTTIEGTLRIVSVDRRDGGDYRYGVDTGDETIPVDVAQDLPIGAADGAIEAEVVDAGAGAPQLAAASVEPAAAATAASSDHRAYIVRVTGTGTLPTAEQATERLTTEVLEEWRVESDGAISSFAVGATKNLAATRDVACGFSDAPASDTAPALWDQGAALFPDVDFDDPGNHLVMLVGTTRCGYSGSPLGIGTLGSSIGSGGAITLLWDSDYVDATLVHELGHNFGLGHANVKSCGTCAEDEYLDIFSVMGFGLAGSEPQALDSLFRDRLGVLAAGEVDDRSLAAGEGQATGSVTLAERGATDGQRAVRVEEADSGKVYWVEYRGGGGRDLGSRYVTGGSFGSAGYLFAPGVTVTQDSTNTAYPEDLELLPNGRSAAYGPSSTFVSPSGETSVRVDSAGSGSATLSVSVRRATPRILTSGLGGAAVVERAAFTRLGTWPAGTQHTYEWQVAGATVSTQDTYTPTAADVGRSLVLSVTSTAPGQAAYTRSTSPVTVGAGRWSSTPGATISGTVRTGRTVTAVKRAWTPAATTSFVSTWYIGGKAFSSAPSLRLSTSWKGRALTLKTVGQRPGYPTVITWTRAGAIK